MLPAVRWCWVPSSDQLTLVGRPSLGSSHRATPHLLSWGCVFPNLGMDPGAGR